MIRSRFISAACALFALCIFADRRADAGTLYPDPRDINDEPFTAHIGAGLGGPLLLGIAEQEGSTTRPLTMPITVQLRAPRYMPLGLELSAIVPSGLGMNLIFDAIRTRYGRVHIVDPGLFYNVGDPVSVRRVPRRTDFTAGLGVDWFPFSFIGLMEDVLAISLNWRTFIPLGSSDVDRDGAPIGSANSEALRGGQLWIGASFRFR